MNNIICPNCGCSVNSGSQFCTNCGMQLNAYSAVQPVVPVNSDKTNSFAIAGFVLSLLNPIACFYLTTFSLIFSIIGMILTKTNKEKGYGLALAGLIITIVPFVLVIFLAILANL